jgi:signal transduction histidine kinase
MTMNAPHKKSKGHVLIVDDFCDNLHLLTDLISTAGYYVRPVTNGKLAIAAAQAIPPDLILLDILMPEMNGFEVCSALKACEQTKNIPIIFLSAMTESENIIKGFELGAEDYIVKPFNPMEVLTRIKTHVELHTNRKKIELQNHKQHELIHVLCHDLMNSIGSVRTVLEIMAVDAENTMDYLKLIRDSVDNGIEIIELVRIITGLEEGKLVLDLDSYPLIELINTAISLLCDKFSKKQISTVVTIAQDIYVTVEYTSFINSVMMNLLTNAIKFSFENSRIFITAEQNQDWVFIQVNDAGIGMPRGLCEDIFSINKATTRAGTRGELGTGFGMPLVKDFVEAYHGTISLESWEKNDEGHERGTTFFISLPR